VQATTQAPGCAHAMPGGCSSGRGSGSVRPPWWYPSPPKGSLPPRLLQQVEGDTKTRLSRRMKGRDCANTGIRARAGERPQVQQHQLCTEGRESQPGGMQTAPHKRSPGLSGWEAHQRFPKGCHQCCLPSLHVEPPPAQHGMATCPAWRRPKLHPTAP